MFELSRSPALNAQQTSPWGIPSPPASTSLVGLDSPLGDSPLAPPNLLLSTVATAVDGGNQQLPSSLGKLKTLMLAVKLSPGLSPVPNTTSPRKSSPGILGANGRKRSTLPPTSNPVMSKTANRGLGSLNSFRRGSPSSQIMRDSMLHHTRMLSLASLPVSSSSLSSSSTSSSSDDRSPVFRKTSLLKRSSPKTPFCHKQPLQATKRAKTAGSPRITLRELFTSGLTLSPMMTGLSGSPSPIMYIPTIGREPTPFTL